MKGKLVIISAPSGAGKTTIVKHLLDSGLNLSFSISATTRPKRGVEKDGIDYFFMTVQEFKKRIENNEFLEWEEVYPGLFYGTLRSELERIWAQGSHVLFDVDVRGGINLKKIYGDRALSIFLMPPSIEELGKRLTNRGTDSYEKVRTRVEKAHEELLLADKFDSVIINDNLERAKETAIKTVTLFLHS
jgi:guanylate kinase